MNNTLNINEINNIFTVGELLTLVLLVKKTAQNFSGLALSRMEMKKVKGGETCTQLGTSVDPSGTCHKVYSCRHSFLGVQYGKSYARFVKQPTSSCYSPPT